MGLPIGLRGQGRREIPSADSTLGKFGNAGTEGGDAAQRDRERTELLEMKLGIVIRHLITRATDAEHLDDGCEGSSQDACAQWGNRESAK